MKRQKKEGSSEEVRGTKRKRQTDNGRSSDSVQLRRSTRAKPWQDVADTVAKGHAMKRIKLPSFSRGKKRKGRVEEERAKDEDEGREEEDDGEAAESQTSTHGDESELVEGQKTNKGGRKEKKKEAKKEVTAKKKTKKTAMKEVKKKKATKKEAEKDTKKETAQKETKKLASEKKEEKEKQESHHCAYASQRVPESDRNAVEDLEGDLQGQSRQRRLQRGPGGRQHVQMARAAVWLGRRLADQGRHVPLRERHWQGPRAAGSSFPAQLSR